MGWRMEAVIKKVDERFGGRVTDFSWVDRESTATLTVHGTMFNDSEKDEIAALFPEHFRVSFESSGG